MPPRYYTGPISDHFDGVRFFDPHGASVAAPYLDQARLQEREMDKGDRGDQRQDLLERARRKLVRRNLGERGRHIDPDPQPDFWEAAPPARHKRNPYDHTHTVDRIFGERE
jgi:hypothetical protein